MTNERPRLDVTLPVSGDIQDDNETQAIAINKQIEEFAATLEPDEWFEVWYESDTEESYDVVRVDADGIHSLEVFENVSVYAGNEAV